MPENSIIKSGSNVLSIGRELVTVRSKPAPPWVSTLTTPISECAASASSMPYPRESANTRVFLVGGGILMQHAMSLGAMRT